MKLNKLSTLVKNSKANFVSHTKYYLAAIAAVLLSAVIIVSVLGFKLGFDFAGGTVVEIVYGVDYDDNGDPYENGAPYTEVIAKEKAEEVIKEIGGLEIASYQTASGNFGNKIVFKLLSDKKLTDEELNSFKIALYEDFNEYSSDGLLQSKYISVYSVDGTESNVAVYASIALAVAIVLFALGAWLRYGLSAALSLMIISLVNIFLVFAVAILGRITVNVPFVASVFTVFILTLISSVIFFDRLRENFKNKNYKDFTRKDYANLAIKESFSALAIIFAISLICIILLTGLGSASIRAFGAPVLGGIIFTALSAFYLSPYLWTLINFKKKK